MVSYQTNTIDGCTKQYIYEYEMADEDGDLPLVETVSEEEDDDEYIEIEVTDDEEEGVDDDRGALPPLPPNKRSDSVGATLPASVPPSNASSCTKDSMDVVSPKAPPPAATPPAPPLPDPLNMLTPSQKRAKAGSSAGLSELSKQLRILQAKNESQAVDINRLERQLRILADLQGISVADLRKALEDACASEAFGELQNRVAKLKFELEAATLAKQNEIKRDTTAPHIANLELRIGELEEVEDKQRAEIRHLYEQLQYEREKSTRLEAENEQLKKEFEEIRRRLQQEAAKANRLQAEFQEQMNKFQEGQTQKMREELLLARERLNSMESSKVGSASKSNQTISPEMAAEYERMAKMLRERDEQLRVAQARLNAEEIKWVQKLKDAEDRALQVQTDMKVELDKIKLIAKELEDADGQSGLRLAQYKARFTVQDERIEDLEGQLESLYTAFTLLKEEFDSENVRRTEMLNNLNDADAEIARQANKVENQKNQRGQRFPPAPGDGMVDGSGSYSGSSESIQSVPRLIATPSTISPVTPSTPSTEGGGLGTHLAASAREGATFDTPAYARAQPYQPTPERTPSTWQLLFPHESQSSPIRTIEPRLGERLVSGPLAVESKGMLRKWKTRPSVIYLRGDHYQWQIGERRSFPLQFGISKVEFNPNHPLSFIVFLNPSDTTAPVIKAACVNERDYRRWMSALTKATTGDDFLEGATPGEVAGASLFSVPQSSSMDDQEAAELQRILELSKHDV